MKYIWLLGITVTYSFITDSWTPQCSPGYVWSGETCVVHYYCKDGTPLLPGGRCKGYPTKQPTVGSNEGVTLPPSQELLCSRRTQFFRRVQQVHQEPRTVLFSNGNAERLFERYLSDSERADLEIDLSSIRVVLVEKGRGRLTLEAPRLGVGEMFKFLTPRRLWSRQLKGLWAQKLATPEREAMRLRADLVCGN